MNRLAYYQGKLKDEEKRHKYLLSVKHTKEEIELQVDVLLQLRIKIIKLSPTESKSKSFTIKRCEQCEEKYIAENRNRFACFKCLPEKEYEARFSGDIKFTAMDRDEAREIAYDFVGDVDFELIDISEQRIVKNTNY